MLKLVALRGESDASLKPINVLDITDFDLSSPGDRLRLCEVIAHAVREDCGYYGDHPPPCQTFAKTESNKGRAAEIARSLFDD